MIKFAFRLVFRPTHLLVGSTATKPPKNQTGTGLKKLFEKRQVGSGDTSFRPGSITRARIQSYLRGPTRITHLGTYMCEYGRHLVICEGIFLFCFAGFFFPRLMGCESRVECM